MFRTAALAVLLTLPPAQESKSSAAPGSLVRLAPKESFLVLQAKNLDGLRADFEGGAWYALYQDDEMKALRGWIEKEIGELHEKHANDTSAGPDPLKSLEALHGSLALFGVLQPGRSTPTFGFLVDPGEPRGAFEDLYAKVLDQMTHDKKLASSTDEHGGVELRLFEVRETDEHAEPAKKPAKSAEADEDGDEDAATPAKSKSDEFHHFAVFEENGIAGFFLAPTREDLLDGVHGALDRASGKDPSSGFEGVPALAQARASVGKPGRLELYFDLSTVIERAREKSPPDEKEKKALELIGVDGLRWMYASADLGKGEAVSIDLAAKIPEKGYLHDWIGLLGKAPKEFAAGAPRECVALSLVQFDVWGLWQSAWKLVADMDKDKAENARAQMEGGLSQFGAEDLEKGFLSQIDGRFLSFNVTIPEDEWKAQLPDALQPKDAGTSSTGTAGHQGTAMILGLRDVASVSRFVEGVLKGVGALDAVKTEEFQGNQIHKFSAPGGSGLSWAFLKQGAAFSQSPTALRAAIRMETAERKDSALEKDSFKPLYDAHADASLLSLATTAESLKGGLVAIAAMRTVAGMGAVMGGKDLSADSPLALLPSAAAIDRHFKGTTASTVSRSGGVLHLQMSSK